MSDPKDLPPVSQPDIAEPARRFCPSCGANWLNDWIDCAICAQRQRTETASDETAAHEHRSIKRAIGLYFSLLAVSLVTLLIYGVGGGEPSVTSDIIVTIIFSVVAICWCIPFRNELSQLLKQTGPAWAFVIAPLLALGTFVTASAIVDWLNNVAGVESIGYLEIYQLEGFSLLLPILMIAVQPALIEELAFRGAIMTSLSQIMSRREVLIVSAMMFGILHLSIPSLPHLVLIGLALGWLRWKTNSLYAGMLLHFIHNLLVLLDERYGFLPW